MFSRIFSLISLIALSGCGRTNAGNKVATANPSRRIECALAGAQAFTQGCAFEPNRDGSALILRHRDGGFRRLTVSNGHELVVADGADVIVGHELPDGRLEVAVAGDRYRLPTHK